MTRKNEEPRGTLDLGKTARARPRGAVAGLRADLALNPLTQGVQSSDQAMRGFKAAMDAALGRVFTPS
jgi:hypothetical protein